MLGFLILLLLSRTRAIFLNGSGSSLAAPVWQAWGLQYQTVRGSTHIRYHSTSSGLGLKALTTADAPGLYQVAFAGSDSLVSAAMYQDFPTLQMVPALVVPLAIIFNLRGFANTELVLNADVTAKLFSGQITNWNHSALSALNPNKALPNLPVKIFIRVQPSGQTEILTRFLASESPKSWPHGVFNKWPPGLTTPMVSFSENVYSLIGSVMSEPGALSYAAYPFCVLISVTYASFCVDPGHAQAGAEPCQAKYLVAPSVETIQATMAQIQLDDKLHAVITPVPGDWPLTDVTYAVFHRASNLTCPEAAEVLKFFIYAFTNQDTRGVARSLGYFTLTKEHVDHVIAYLSELTCPQTGASYLAADFSAEDGHDVTRHAMIGIAVVGLVLAGGLWVSIVSARGSRVARVAGLLFTSLFVLGCALNYLAVILWAIEPDTDRICEARFLTVITGHTLILAVMFSKSGAVYSIIQMTKKGRLKRLANMSSARFVYRMLFMLVPQSVVLVVWFVLDPPVVRLVVVDPLDRMYVRACTVSEIPELWISLEAAVFVVSVCWGGWLAMKTRDFYDRYQVPNESKAIYNSLYNMFLCGLFFVPIVSDLGPGSAIFTFVVCTAIAVPTSFALASVLVPKVAALAGTCMMSRASADNFVSEEDGITLANSGPSSGHLRVQQKPEDAAATNDLEIGQQDDAEGCTSKVSKSEHNNDSSQPPQGNAFEEAPAHVVNVVDGDGLGVA